MDWGEKPRNRDQVEVHGGFWPLGSHTIEFLKRATLTWRVRLEALLQGDRELEMGRKGACGSSGARVSTRHQMHGRATAGLDQCLRTS